MSLQISKRFRTIVSYLALLALTALVGCGGGSTESVAPATPQPAATDDDSALLPWSDSTQSPQSGAQSKTAPTVGSLKDGDNFLSDIAWTSARNDLGPAEADSSNGSANPNDGDQPLTIGSASFTKGLGVHGESELVYALGGQCSQFSASVGINSRRGSLVIGSRGSVIFEVWGDGVRLKATGVVTGASTAQVIALDIANVKELKLVTHNNGNSNYDHADWADAKVTCALPAAVAWTYCADDGGFCGFTGTRQVRFGANASYNVKTLTAQSGGTPCNSQVFGDPAPAAVKHCEVDGTPTPVLAPTIAAFTASPATINVGASTSLNWNVANAESLSIDNGVGTVTGTSVTVTPTTTTTYTLTARNVAGPATKAVTVTVNAVPPMVSAPTITFFTATPNAVNSGASTTLSWSVTDATSLSVAPGIGAVTGTSVIVTPSANTTYTLTASGAGGTTTKTASVTVNVVTPTTQWTFCANQFAYCGFIGLRDVRFGVEGKYRIVEIYGYVDCRPSTFGGDPAPGATKHCDYGPAKTGAIAPPDHSASGPYIDLAKVPRGAPGYAEERIKALAAGEEAPSTPNDGVGAFRNLCDMSHMSYDDPIVYPGKFGAAHLHLFFGNTGADANSDAASLRNTGKSTCAGGTLNRTAYWVPAMIDTKDGTPLTPLQAIFYYKSGYNGVRPSQIKTMPDGLRMIAGNAKASAPPSGDAGYYFTCENSGGKRSNTIVNCAVGVSMVMVIEFPQCWDGSNLDSPDHKSHMAFAHGGCPASHPIAIPEITYNIYYRVSETNAPLRWRLSSDAYDPSLPAGYSSHGDWFDAWKPDTKAMFIRNCTAAPMDCHAFDVGEGQRLY